MHTDHSEFEYCAAGQQFESDRNKLDIEFELEFYVGSIGLERSDNTARRRRLAI